MSDRLLLEQAIEAVADGQPVDWDLLDSQATGTDLREDLACLRILGDLHQLHASTAGGDEPSDGGVDADGDDDPLANRTPRDGTGSGAATPAPAAAAAAGAKATPTAAADQDSAAIELGLWGRFRLLAKVGQGSFGRVYRAWDPNLEREVALKILRGTSMSDALKERILHEGRALARIRDTNVVAVHGVEWHEGRAALCMEFVRGRTLDDVVFSDGRLPVQDVVRIGRDVCRALSAVHRSGFVHRDVKARNVMRDESGRIVLMDFGAGQAVRRSDSARASDAAGTPLYMAPELFDGGEASPRSDVYSVAVLLFYLLTGEYPREAQTLAELRAAHRTPFRPLRQRRPEIPAALARVVERALAVNPQDRFPHATALLEALDGQQLRRDAWSDARQEWKRIGVRVSAVAAVMLGIGCLTTVVFDHTLNRGDFSNEGWGDWLKWGVKASVAPSFVLLSGWLLSICLRLGREFLLGVSDRAVEIDAAIRRPLKRWVTRFRLDDATTLAAFVLLFMAMGLIVLWWRFLPLLDAVSTFAANGAPPTLALLSPALEWYQDRYRQAFSMLLLAGVIGWQIVMRTAARQGQPPRTELLTSAAIVAILVVASLDLPYRVLLHSKFEVAAWEGNTCYVLGTHAADTLLFCPRLSPRHRIIATPTEVRRKGGLPENIYTEFATARTAP